MVLAKGEIVVEIKLRSRIILSFIVDIHTQLMGLIFAKGGWLPASGNIVDNENKMYDQTSQSNTLYSSERT